MEQTKEWYKSHAVWAGVVTAIIGVLSLFGLGDKFAAQHAAIVEIFVQWGTLIGGMYAVWGRLRATKELTRGSNIPKGRTSFPAMLIMVIVLVTLAGGCSRVNFTQDAWSDGTNIAADLLVVRDHVQAGKYTDEQVAEVMDDVADWLQSLIIEDSGNKISPRFRQHVITQKNITRRKAQILRGDDVPPGYAAKALERTAAMVNLFRRADSGLPSE